MNPEFEKLPLGGHAANNLTPEEKQAVYRAALDNQEVFDELANSEHLRQLLQKPSARRELLAALDEADRKARQTWLEKLTGWLAQPAGRLVLAGGLAAAFAIGLFYDKLLPTKPTISTGPELAQQQTGPTDAGILGGQIFALALAPVTKDLGAPALSLNQQTYRPGDPLRITVSAPAGGYAVVTELRPDGTYYQHFPNALESSAKIPPSGELTIPASGQGAATVNSTPGVYRLRLAIFPPDLNPLTGSVVSAASRITVLETQYTVAP